VLPAWLQFFKTKGKEGKKSTIRPGFDKEGKSKPAYYKEGETLKACWKHRMSAKQFCSVCGNYMINPTGIDLHCKDYDCKGQTSGNPCFAKYQGQIKITKIEGLEFGKNKDGFFIRDKEFGYWAKSNIEDVAWMDGFKDIDQMFQYFDKNYDLTKPKLFWRYQYEYAGGIE